MPGPFPGMDPYLEDIHLWRGVHHRLIYCIAQSLNKKLLPKYAAEIDERLYVMQPSRIVYPDVALSKLPEAKARQGRAAGGVATMEREDPPHILTFSSEQVTEGFIEIRTLDPPKRTVTIIEVLNYTNKTPNSEGRREYIKKQAELLRSEIHLLEIDLLRRGQHTVAVPAEGLVIEGEEWDYLVCLHRSGQGPTYEYWPIRARMRLPRVRVPLAEDDPDVILDLQAVFNRCYDEGPYAYEVDYRQNPPTPLQAEDAAWANALLQKKGLRS